MSDNKDRSLEEYKAYKQEKHRDMLQRQMLPYEVKVRMAEIRIRDFYEEALRRDVNCHVSVGGLDSITLAYFIRKGEEFTGQMNIYDYLED